MNEFISKDQAIKEFYAREDDYDPEWGNLRFSTSDVEEILMSMHPVDAVPVCHAFWYWDKDGMDWNIGAWRCSACHNRPNTIWETEKNLRPRRWSGSAYCSNCGAVMDGKEKSNESETD